MRFLLNQTNARAFSLSLPDPQGRARALGFEHITDLGGVVEHTPAQLTLQSTSADGFRLTEVDWNTPHGRVSIGAPATVANLRVDGHIPLGDHRSLPLEGRASLKLLDAESVVVEGALPRLSCGVRVEHLAVEQTGDGGAATVGAVMVRDLQTTAAGFLLRLGTAEVEEIHLAWSPRRTEIVTSALALGKLEASSRNIDFAIEELVMPRGMNVVGGQICIPELAIAKITMTIDQLQDLLPREGGEQAKTEAKTDSGNDWIQIPLDPRLLDLVNGRFAVDVTVDAALPVIGRRKATHAFRVPIESGTLNYKQLERGLSTLEDAVIDFELRNSKLVIERDIPIIRLRKNLVEWSLDEDELALAQQRRVRLRTLPHYRLVSGGGNDIKINSVHLDPIDIALTVGDGQALEAAQANGENGSTSPADGAQEGAAGADAASARAEEPPLEGILPRLRIGSLEISGCLRSPDQAGLLAIAIRNILASLRNLTLGSVQVDVGTIAVDAIEPIQITFDGVRPDAASVTIEGLRLQDIKLQRRPA